jgi:hypothetical protein
VMSPVLLLGLTVSWNVEAFLESVSMVGGGISPSLVNLG